MKPRAEHWNGPSLLVRKSKRSKEEATKHVRKTIGKFNILKAKRRKKLQEGRGNQLCQMLLTSKLRTDD